MIFLINTIIHFITRLKKTPVDVKSSTYIDSSKEINDKYPKFKVTVIILLEYQNIKTFLLKTIFQIGRKKFLLLKKLKALCRGHMLLVILKVKKLLAHFTKKNYKTEIKKSLGLKK